MKKIYFLILIATTLGISSCTQDFIQLEPKMGLQEANFYKTQSDGDQALNAVYDALSFQNWNFVPTTADIRSDDSFAGGDPSGNDMIQWQQQERWKIDTENAAVLALWKRCYMGINRANIVLEKADQIQWASSTNKKRVVAEARFLRAYFYWDLVRHFGWAPMFLHTVIPSEAAIPVASPSDLYTQIAKDLLYAKDSLPSKKELGAAASAQIGHANKDVANALIARIYLYYTGVSTTLGITGPWTNGTVTIDKTYAKSCLTSIISSGSYKLLSNYADVFSWAMQNNDEDVFSFQYNSTSGSTDWGEGFYINGNFSCEWQGPRDPVGDPGAKGGWSFNIPTFALAAEFEDGDPRKDVSLYDASTKLKSYTRGYQNTGYFNNKFRSNPAYISAKGDPAHNWALNYPDIRYADVLLMAAELSLGTPDAALYLNKVRTRALGANAAKVSVTIDDIYHERRVELAGEGHRYWDILRRGLDYAKTQIDASFKNIPTKPMVNLPDFNTIDKQFDKTTYGMFPIPGSEVRLSGGVYKQNIPAYLGM